MTSKELREKAKILSDEIAALEVTPEDELTNDEAFRFTEAVEEAKELSRKIQEADAEERAEAIKFIREAGERVAATATAPNVEAAAGVLPEPKQRTAHNARKRNPYEIDDFRTLSGLRDAQDAEGSIRVSSSVANELRSRAHDAVEQAPEYVSHEARGILANHVDRDEDGRIAAHYLRYGAPEYTSAFFHYLRTGEHRTALSTSSSNGGYLIPFYLDPTIILTNAGAVNPFRQISRVETITTNVWHGVSSAGVTAEWSSEANEMADASPTFTQPTVTPIRADAYVQASFEVTQDSNIASQIGMLFADAKNRLEATAFATGTGSTQPEGLVTRLAATTASRVAATTNGSFGGPDIFALVNNLPARYQDNCAWLAHWGIFNNVRQFAATSSPQASLFWVDLGPGQPSQLLGRSTYQSSAMTSSLSAATASNDDVLVLGDFSNFLIVDRVGMEVVYNPLVLGSTRRPTGEVGWAAFWRVGSDTTNADGFRLLRV